MADDPMIPWATVVVRAWPQDGRLIVRMTFDAPGRAAVVHYEQSGSAAGRRLADWIDGLSGDEPETPRRRTGSGLLPTVSDLPPRSEEN
jgi:hypothetical protein